MYYLTNVVNMIKYRRWEDHVALMEEVRSAFKMFTVKYRGKRPPVNLGLDRALFRIYLK